MPTYLSDDHRLVKVGRFLNVLDDAENKLSPVKINVWGANLAAVSTVAAGVVTWIGGHLGNVGDIGALVGGWLAQAHGQHHFDKRQRDIHEERMK